MTKVKVFNFEVSNCAYGADKDDFKERWYKINTPKLVSYDEVEETINNFLKDKNYIDMRVWRKKIPRDVKAAYKEFIKTREDSLNKTK